MGRVQTMVQLTDELVSALDEVADRRGVSRSAVVRDALDAYLRQGAPGSGKSAALQLVHDALAAYHPDDAEAGAVERLVDGYRRHPPATPDAWGDPAEASGHATREMLQRLDAEEADAGVESW